MLETVKANKVDRVQILVLLPIVWPDYYIVNLQNQNWFGSKEVDLFRTSSWYSVTADNCELKLSTANLADREWQFLWLL